MPPLRPPLAALASLAAVLALVAAASPARAACQGARAASGVAAQPAPWRSAVEALVRSTFEEGHPWSCAGGEIDVQATEGGGTLRVTRAGEATATRHVASPDDVLPLGQALLSLPISLPPGPEPAKTPAPGLAERPAEPPAREAPPGAASPPRQPDPRLIVGAALDARHVGPTRVVWIGPSVSAAVPFGDWLPLVTLRQQSAILSGRPPIDELSMGVAVLRRFDLRRVELRAGARLGAAAVQRDLPRPQGAQGRLDGRVGVMTSVVIPAWRSLRLVFTLDGELVVASRAAAEPEQAGASPPRAFPSYTAGGAAGVEFSL